MGELSERRGRRFNSNLKNRRRLIIIDAGVHLSLERTTITRKKWIRHICVGLSMSAWKNVGARERDNVNIHIRAGKVAAFVGESGSEKSTLLNLALWLYLPMKGEIIIDGISLSERDINDFRHYVSVVARNSILFSGTLWDYLVFDIPYVSTEQVSEMIRHAGLEELVQSPHG